MSDPGSTIAKGKSRAAASAAKVRCRFQAFTGLRPSELMRYRPEHWNRTTQTLVLYTGKGGRTRTIPLSAPATAALADLEAVGAIGPFSTSTLSTGLHPGSGAARDPRRAPLLPPPQLRTALYRVARDTRLVKDVLGHSDSRMTERYTLGHVPAAMGLATSRFEEHLGPPGEPLAAQNRAARRAGARTDA